jgi:hypothetical protein
VTMTIAGAGTASAGGGGIDEVRGADEVRRVHIVHALEASAANRGSSVMRAHCVRTRFCEKSHQVRYGYRSQGRVAWLRNGTHSLPGDSPDHMAV